MDQRLGEEKLYDERALLLLIAGGDKQAFNQLFDAYWDQVYGTSLHLTKSPEQSKDLAQDIFLKLWERRAALPSVQNFSGFLYTITRNLVHDHLRTKVFRDSNLAFLIHYFSSDGISPQRQLEQKELTGALEQAVMRLPAQLQRVFILHRMEGLSHGEIAQRLNITPLSSKTYMVRALMALRVQLAENADKLLIIIFLCRCFFFS